MERAAALTRAAARSAEANDGEEFLDPGSDPTQGRETFQEETRP